MPPSPTAVSYALLNPIIAFWLACTAAAVWSFHAGWKREPVVIAVIPSVLLTIAAPLLAGGPMAGTLGEAGYSFLLHPATVVAVILAIGYLSATLHAVGGAMRSRTRPAHGSAYAVTRAADPAPLDWLDVLATALETGHSADRMEETRARVMAIYISLGRTPEEIETALAEGVRRGAFSVTEESAVDETAPPVSVG